EPGEPLGVPRHRIGKHLDRDLAMQLRVFRPVDLAHPSRAERRENFVRAEFRPGGECHDYFCLPPSAPRSAVSGELSCASAARRTRKRWPSIDGVYWFRPSSVRMPAGKSIFGCPAENVGESWTSTAAISPDAARKKSSLPSRLHCGWMPPLFE